MKTRAERLEPGDVFTVSKPTVVAYVALLVVNEGDATIVTCAWYWPQRPGFTVQLLLDRCVTVDVLGEEERARIRVG